MLLSWKCVLFEFPDEDDLSARHLGRLSYVQLVVEIEAFGVDGVAEVEVVDDEFLGQCMPCLGGTCCVAAGGASGGTCQLPDD